MARMERGSIRRSGRRRCADRADQLTASGKVCLPLGLEAAEGQTEPVRWRMRKSRQLETGLVDEPVLLLGVAAAARRDDVVPRVRPAARLRDHVIQVLRRRATVLTRPVITREHGSTGERRLSAIGNANEPPKTEHRGRVHRDVLRVEDLTVGGKNFGFLLQDKHHGAPRSDHRERLVRRVQDQCSSHAGKASIRSHLQELGMERSPPSPPRHVQMLDLTESQCCDSPPRRRRLRPTGYLE
jgi:hypothetical protein